MYLSNWKVTSRVVTVNGINYLVADRLTLRFRQTTPNDFADLRRFGIVGRGGIARRLANRPLAGKEHGHGEVEDWAMVVLKAGENPVDVVRYALARLAECQARLDARRAVDARSLDRETPNPNTARSSEEVVNVLITA